MYQNVVRWNVDGLWKCKVRFLYVTTNGRSSKWWPWKWHWGSLYGFRVLSAPLAASPAPNLLIWCSPDTGRATSVHLWPCRASLLPPNHHMSLSSLASRSWLNTLSVKFSSISVLPHSMSCYLSLSETILFIFCDKPRSPLPALKISKLLGGGEISLFYSFLYLQSLLAYSGCAINIWQVNDLVGWVWLVGLKVMVAQLIYSIFLSGPLNPVIE